MKNRTLRSLKFVLVKLNCNLVELFSEISRKVKELTQLSVNNSRRKLLLIPRWD